MKPLPAPDLSVQTSGPRRSKKTRGAEARAARVELRVDERERAAWILGAEREGYLSLSDWCRDRLNSAARSRIHYSSAFDAWNTPREILDELRRALGHSIRLDPCSNDGSIVGAAVAFHGPPGACGLTLPWSGALDPDLDRPGFVYVNPPFGEELPGWIAKCASEARAGSEIVALVPARTDTQWWNLAASTCAAFLLWRGRVTFLGAPSTAPFPIALFYWGARVERFATIERGAVYPGGGARR